MRFLIIVLINGLFLKSVVAQTVEKTISPWLLFGHAEIASLFPNSEIKESLPIRQNVVSQQNYSSDAYLRISTWANSFSIKAELFNTNYKVGIATGLSFILYETSIVGSVSENSNYFYFRYFNKDQETKFARVKKLGERQHFLTIPVELRYYFFSRKRYGFFIKLSSNVGWNLNSQLTIVFQDPEINAYKNEVLGVLHDSNNKFYTSLSPSVGFRYNYLHKLCINGELTMPSTYLGNGYFILTSASRYFGIKASLQVPINSKNH